MKSWIKEPLVQFLALGSVLYFVAVAIAPGQLQQDEQYHIEVSDKSLIRYLQFQAKTFDANAARTKYQSLSAPDKQTLLERYVHDEVLVREALALGLDKNDEVIRRRLMQKMDYVGQGFSKDVAAISEAELRRFFEESIEDYRLAANISFTHVFFNSRSRGHDSALDIAKKTLASLNQERVPFSSSVEYGDRFIFKRNYIDQSQSLIQGHFGKGFETLLFTLDSGPQWQGPFESDYGVHLVSVKSSNASRLPELAEVSSTVLADIRRQQLHALQRQSFEKIRGKYSVSTEWAQE